MRVLLVFALFVSCNVSALNCKSPVTQLEMNRCAYKELQTETKKINRIYLKIRKNLSTNDKNRIKKVQLAWIKYKDLSCKFEAKENEGGTLHSLVLSECLTNKTIIRRKQLEKLYERIL